MNCPVTQQFGLDQIPVTFEGELGTTDGSGPGVYLGRMDPDTGEVPLPDSPTENRFPYSF